MTNPTKFQSEPWQLRVPQIAAGYPAELIDKLRVQVKEGSLSSIESGLALLDKERSIGLVRPVSPFHGMIEDQPVTADNFGRPNARQYR